MDIIYKLGSVTVADVASRLPDPPTATAVRTMLRILEDRGHVRHRVDGLRNVYTPVVPAEQANRNVLRHVVETFFHGSHAKAMAMLLETPAALSNEELDRLRALIDRARRRR
jgi:predicted transcriptional regulator